MKGLKVKNDILNKDFVYGTPMYRTSPDGEWVYEDTRIKHNIVTYNGRDFLANLSGISSTSEDIYINLVALGLSSTAANIADVSLGSLIGSSSYKVIDDKIPASLSQRGLIVFETSFTGNDFDAVYNVYEAGLYIVQSSDPTVPATYNGKPWLFARVVFPSSFVVQPWSEGSGIERGLLLRWFLQF